MKIFRSILIIGGLVVVSGVFVYVVYALANHYLQSTETSKPAVVPCQKLGNTHKVVIRNSVVTPQHTQAMVCGTLTITNDDAIVRLIAFGPHEHHQPYDGITERALDKGQSLTVTLNQLGTYTFHDHLNDTVIGSFTVTR